ncbi:hypothetical protein I3842_02G009300 [Carya illinoinensis]|uniref:Uncharacterized protein n=1 Tax=Carya illinoinensis TaxID=32201 RepID=A0A922FSV9_CARIL|nr:hypothetical protein I3842_02G009300 [Carya illinoinensis]
MEYLVKKFPSRGFRQALASSSPPPPSVSILSPTCNPHHHPLGPIVTIVFFSAILKPIIRTLDGQWIPTWYKVHSMRLLNSKYIGGDGFRHGLFW